ncbi:lytic transglycosylase domain-containing protein [Microvirga pudoricolor]|uniref:lytic transglycosylase domain-containing protein n=1 Tax=Microvirga pudoricolor TaxID=2778729 RepID=UPI00194DE453|nr:lytic transglycosylase domain-containing protein [Microvirga pudoricolor]MBM6594335.1 lytic transglycosylase domain-containing protein [Microvirga pudoricolor]
MSLTASTLARLLASAAVVQVWSLAALASEPPPGPMLHEARETLTTSALEDLVPPPPPALTDADYLPLVLKAYRQGDPIEADIFESKLKPAGLAAAEWFNIRSGRSLTYDRIRAFQETNPDWPVSTLLRRRAEEAFLAARKPSAEVRRFFAERAPVTLGGRIAQAFALQAEGQEAEAAEKIRQVWREDTFGGDVEDRILDRFPGLMTQADHRYRMERLLFKEVWGGATRSAERAGKPYDTLVKARLGIYQGKKKAEKAFAAVPASLRSDPSYLYSRALYLRRSGKVEDAARIMAQTPQDPELLVDGDSWWAERRYVTRELLDDRNYKLAYEVASRHGAESPAQAIEAEFHAGWIALRFLDDSKAAAGHFANAANNASTPISIARAAYWQGRAADAVGAADEAKAHYRRAAERPTTYYGQLSLTQLGQKLSLRAPAPLTEDERRAFEDTTPYKAANLLQQIGESDLALSLYTELAQTMDDPARLDILAASATAQQNARAVLAIGKTAVQRGLPLDAHAYPVAGIPDFEPVGDEVETAMVYAIARQESAFNPKAQSGAGARGLMQLMPATAKRTAQRFGVPYDPDRLLSDPSYNAKLGSAHLGELMEDWKGSYILAFASYNAGGGNVKKWIDAYGDPRKPQVDMVDWIERIPFYETRNYVQRVMENLTVYRQRLDSKPDPNGTEYQVSDPTEY